ncbi:MAG TPA: transcription antitermination factor NusB [Capsulimonadaceae bacterium]|nr:transcription antitermination factor NusB [Capsulimonadaceae bacterium]
MEPDGSPSHGSPHKTEHKNTRREARELVLRMLFQVDVGKQPMDEVIEAALAQSVLEGANRQYAEAVVRGTLENKNQIDEQLEQLASDWSVERQAVVDRNILRLTTYEILYRPDTPVAAVINEAVELAKKYSTAESGRFVNGVLGALARSVPRGQDSSDCENADELAQESPAEEDRSPDF